MVDKKKKRTLIEEALASKALEVEAELDSVPPQPEPYDAEKERWLARTRAPAEKPAEKKAAAKPAAKKSKPQPKTLLSGKQEFFNGRGEENRTASRSVQGQDDEKKPRTIFSKYKGKNLFSE